MNEIESKLAKLRDVLSKSNLASIRLRGCDWFSWATGGASSVVLQTMETGVAEIFVSEREAFLLTDAIEAPRMLSEVLPPPYLLWNAPWEDAQAREAFVHDHSRGGFIASDRPRGAEHRLPDELCLARREMGPDEIERYRQLGLESAQAMHEALDQATPAWSEFDLAAAGASALWKRGIHPALILSAGDQRLQAYRHPTPSSAKLGERAMLVFCARRHGLFANLTRFVYFRAPTEAEQKLKEDVATIEATAWQQSMAGRTLAQIYQSLTEAYTDRGYAGELSKHHQGGPTGYAAREALAGPDQHEAVAMRTALAWNPSLSGTKIEDTVVVHGPKSLEILTCDPSWPSFQSGAHSRPDYLVKK